MKFNESSDDLSFLDDIDLSHCDIVKSEPINSGFPDFKPSQVQDLFSFLDIEGTAFSSHDEKAKENDAFVTPSPTTSAGLQNKHKPEVFSDCMWSAAAGNSLKAKGRKRDVSITLTECNNGLATITSLEMLDILGRTPPVVDGLDSSNNLMWNPLNDTSETERDSEEEEEIDVVTSNPDDDDVMPWVTCQQTNIQRIEAGKDK